MNDIYDAPGSDLRVETDEGLVEQREALAKLLGEERWILGQVAAFFGTVTFFLLMFLVEGAAPMFIYLAPSIFSGVVLKYYARFVTSKPRIISGVIVLLVTMGFLSLFGLSILAIAISFIAFLACMALNRRPLTMEQEKLLYAWKHRKSRLQ